jgi:hypothetical protein
LPVKPSGGSPDVQMARALFTLRHAVSHWIIAAPEVDGAEFPHLAGAIPDWLVITPTTNDQVVAAYQELKRAMAISTPEHDPQALMVSADPANAAVIHTRLRRAVAEFLKKDLPLAAVATISSPAPTRVAAIAATEADYAAVYATILDELCGTSEEVEEESGEAFEDEVIEAAAVEPVKSLADVIPATHRDLSIDIDESLDAVTAAAVDLALHSEKSVEATSALFDGLTNVLDPEERDALTAQLFSSETDAPEVVEEARVVTSPEVVEAPVVEAVKPVKKNSFVPAGSSLTVLDGTNGMEKNRGAQWERVEASIPALAHGCVMLDAKPPMTWARESSLALDGNGALHLWTLQQEGVSWFALREWASEHRSLLRLTRRDLPMRDDAPISVHVVLPLSAGETPPEVAALLRSGAANLSIYRLRAVNWGEQNGVVVVPIS